MRDSAQPNEDESNDMNDKSFWIRGAVCATALLASSSAFAANCTLHNLITMRLRDRPTEPIKQNAPIGSLVKEITWPGTGARIATCDGVTQVDSLILGLAQSELPDIYKTEVEGLGVKIEWEQPGMARRAYPYRDTLDNPVRYEIQDNGQLHVGFYRIAGDFTGGVVGAGGSFDVAEARLDTAVRMRRVLFDNIPFRLATCSITTASLFQTVDLGRRTPRDFGADGGSPWVGFKLISDDCDLTQFSDATFTFSGTTVVGAPELFAVTGGAGGVGVQLGTAGGTDIVPGVDLDMPVLAAGGEYGFRARFKRTVDPLVSGRARAEVVVRVDYD